MNILKNLFEGSRRTKQIETTEFSTPETTVVEADSKIIPPVELFIDNEVPRPEQQAAAETQSRILIFLSKNYTSMGINDGYEYHSQETLEIGKKKLKAEFQLIVDQSIQEKSEKRLQMKTMIVTVTRISDEVKQNLELTIEELNSSIALLNMQKELSSENEGWVMNAIHSYHQGFVQGLNDYIAGELLLNSIKNI